VQFRVSWNAIPSGTCHNSKIWLWVDFVKIENNQPSGTWTRATVVNALPAASVSYDGSKRKGFWLQGNTGSYNQIVTVNLDIPANTKFNWCAYTSDCPPNVTANNGTYTFKGAPPFILTAATGTASQTVTGTTLAASALTITPATIRDKTECPGDFCIYKGSDLFIDGTHLCQQRTSGARNWEAYIKDSRDNLIYKIVQFTDGSWWFAEYLNTIENKMVTCGTMNLYSGSNKPDCPSEWELPSMLEIKQRYPSWNQTAEYYGGDAKPSTHYRPGSGCMTSPKVPLIVTKDASNPFAYLDNVWRCVDNNCNVTSIYSNALCKRNL
jgi:hypothetical protein